MQRGRGPVAPRPGGHERFGVHRHDARIELPPRSGDAVADLGPDVLQVERHARPRPLGGTDAIELLEDAVDVTQPKRVHSATASRSVPGPYRATASM